MALEPTVASSQSTSETFTVSQEITGEVSFVGAVDNATITPSIAGLSGGTANGSTTFAVNSNNPDGYTVTIAFANPATNPMRLGNGSDAAKNIPSLGDTVRLDFDDGVGANEARFGFTVAGTNAANRYKNNGASCNQSGGTATGTRCWWLGDTSSPETIVDSSTTASAEEHTLYFRVQVNENPSPTLELGTYTATATLTVAQKT